MTPGIPHRQTGAPIPVSEMYGALLIQETGMTLKLKMSLQKVKVYYQQNPPGRWGAGSGPVTFYSITLLLMSFVT